MILNLAVSELTKRARRINANPEERGVLSRGQLVEVALLLNRPDWLAEEGFTLVDAIDRLTHAELNAVVFASRNLDLTPVVGANNP